MSRNAISPLYHVHAEALASGHATGQIDVVAPTPPPAASVEDWQQALKLADVVVHLEEEEFAEAPPDPTYADTEAVVVDASARDVASARAL